MTWLMYVPFIESWTLRSSFCRSPFRHLASATALHQCPMGSLLQAHTTPWSCECHVIVMWWLCKGHVKCGNCRNLPKQASTEDLSGSYVWHWKNGSQMIRGMSDDSHVIPHATHLPQLREAESQWLWLAVPDSCEDNTTTYRKTITLPKYT